MLKTVKLTARGIQDQTITLGLCKVPKSARLARAAKALGICLGAATISIFIPLVHFVLVPGFILAGLFFAGNAYSDDVVLEGGEIRCPFCIGHNKLTDLTDCFPKFLNCSHCQAEYQLSDRT